VRFADAHPDDARVISVVFSDDPDDVKRFFDERGGDWPIVHDDDGAIATAWGVARVPESYLVGPNGRVVGKITGGVTFEFLEAQLARYGRRG
jgi:cytochrome c biogenesis protein CcmG, thiol:disulfide interchange protein DsbE